MLFDFEQKTFCIAAKVDACHFKIFIQYEKIKTTNERI